MDAAGFGPMVVARTKQLASADARALKDIQLFNCGMPMRSVPRTGRHADHRRHAGLRRIYKQNFHADAGDKVLPESLAGADEQEARQRRGGLAADPRHELRSDRRGRMDCPGAEAQLSPHVLERTEFALAGGAPLL